MVQLTVVGSLNYDLVSYTDRIPAGGETYAGQSFETHTGGKGLNQTISLAKLSPHVSDSNLKVRIIGKVGQDAFGKELIEELTKEGVDVSNVEAIEGERSGVAVIIVEKNSGENRILITAGANGKAHYSNDELVQLFPKDFGKEVVVFQNEIPGTLDTIKWLKENRPQAEVVYNPSPYNSQSSEIIDKVDILVVNEGEALDIAKDILPIDEFKNFEQEIESNEINGFLKLATQLKTKIDQSNSNVVVITLGSKGSIFTSPRKTDDSTSKFVESVKVSNVVDTTAAGDTFLGGLVTQVSLGQSIENAVKFATKASSLTIQHNGASETIPTFEKVIESFK
ncbi:putative ribokinase [Wickerhamomyces ciferrii]|uniref:Ribokinase n=1 Tax=Wickerhamomyces ciferrii (strain ATCC 14091 / BCRC 22168 / CBS 111 / JCM 3599 / NBRC 0793 / NRRL Y-1031 F-60-10) TaxID=1206466 RepID=K0KH80_WICCF|nr:putative ribokinase [Wickerhamomyces ciferrii]CCH42351.1 putative ribokinase [Wickerhamomyces ciferrii]